MQFAEFLNEGFPAHLRILSLPACVGFGTGAVCLVRSFSWQCGSLGFGSSFELPPCHVSAFHKGDLPPLQPTGFDALFHSRAQAPSCVTPSLKRLPAVLECLPVVHRLCLLPRLRSRLTLGRRALPRKPQAFGGPDSCWPFRYSYRHSHCHALHRSFRYGFAAHGTLPYPAYFRMQPQLRFCT